jgi:hypothetical protein
VRQDCPGNNGSSAFVGPTCFTTPLTAPGNDEPCGAITLGNGVLSGSNVGATTSLQPGIITPACSPAASPRDVWFTITPSGTSTTLTLTGNAAGMVRVYSSPNCSAGPFVQVSCAGNAANTAVGTVTVPGLNAGQRYYVAVSGFGSADASGSFTISGTNLLATRTQTESSALVVYPNPSSTGQLTLRLKVGHATGQATLLNALGQAVLAKDLSAATEQTLSTKGLAAGVYTLRVALGNDVLTRKVVLE